MYVFTTYMFGQQVSHNHKSETNEVAFWFNYTGNNINIQLETNLFYFKSNLAIVSQLLTFTFTFTSQCGGINHTLFLSTFIIFHFEYFQYVYETNHRLR